MTAEQAQALIDLKENLLEEVRNTLRQEGAFKARSALEKRVSPEIARALLDAADCQLRFVDKFEKVEHWLLTREAAEQATRSSLACWRARYLKERFPSLSRLTELGTGIGGDSVYLAREFELDGYEKDPARVRLAASNIAKLSPNALPHRLHEQAAQPGELSGELLFVDPARRESGRKFHPEDWKPPLSSLLALKGFDGVVIKAAPGLLTEVVPEGFEIHFLSHQGELKEAMLLRPVGPITARHAWLWPKGQVSPLHLWGHPQQSSVREPKPGDYLLNPDPALLRSGLLGRFAAALEAGVVHPKIGYLSSPVPSPDAWADSFLILEASRLNWKRLAEALPRLEWGDYEYLGRGVPFSQNEVRGRLDKAKKKMSGSRRGSVIIYRDESDYQAVLAQRIDSQVVSY